MSTDIRGRHFVRALSRGLAIIESFDDARSGVSLTDIAQRTDLSRGTAARILKTLESLGYVRAEDGRFMLLPRALKLGYAYLSSQPLWRLAEPMLETVVQDIGEICSIGILDGDEIVSITWISSARASWSVTGLGGHVPAYCTAIGRVLLAGVPDDVLDNVLTSPRISARTRRTVTDPPRLRKIIAEARRNGYATQDEELEMGWRAIAVPVRDASGAIVAGLNVNVPTHRFSMKVLTERALPVLQREAAKLSEVLSFTLPRGRRSPSKQQRSPQRKR